jgi:hypothetical protein
LNTLARRPSVTLLTGILLGAVLTVCLQWGAETTTPAVADQTADTPEPSLVALAADVEMLKGRMPDQAHAMQDVGYHFANLWFAGDARNWRLADFYWNETRSHLRWAVRIIPVRKDSVGQEIDLGKILEAVETTPLAQLRTAIDEQDHDKFVAAYRFTLEGCYACHKASDKPFIRPQVPRHSEAEAINFDPAADWPK